MGLLYHISVVRSISMSVRCAIALCAMILSCGTQALCAPIANQSVEYPYIIYVDSAYIPVLDNEEFQSVAATVIFPVNKTALPADSPVLVELNDDVLPMLNSDSIEALRIDLRGAASPEGTLPRNTYLGEARMRALLSFVQNRLDVPLKDADMRMLSEAEDYLTLAMLMREAGDKDYDRVKTLCDRYLPAGRYDAMKRELRAVDDGRLWHRLLSTYYPQLRTAQLVIYCKRKTDERRVRPTHLPLRVFNTAALPGKVDFTFGPKRYPRRELLSVKTNLLLYGVYMPGGYDKWCPIPNFTIEYYPLHGHFTFAGTFDCPWWQDYWGHKYFQIRNYQLEARYYLRSGDIRYNPPGQGPAFRGLYVQGYANVALYGLCFDADRGWVGEGIGAGVGIGYVQKLDRRGHWKLEFSAQFGFFTSKYDPYQYENPVNPNYRDHLYYYKWTQSPELFKKRQYHHTYVGPTCVGVTISYDLLYRKIKKRGASFRRWEWY